MYVPKSPTDKINSTGLRQLRQVCRETFFIFFNFHLHSIFFYSNYINYFYSIYLIFSFKILFSNKPAASAATHQKPCYHWWFWFSILPQFCRNSAAKWSVLPQKPMVPWTRPKKVELVLVVCSLSSKWVFCGSCGRMESFAAVWRQVCGRFENPNLKKYAVIM